MERKQSAIPWVRGNCIGKGSFGAVHLASSLNGAVFAVKSASAGSPQAGSLETEIQVLSSLSSPYVVKYLGDDVSAEYRNLHMEYLPGGTAADLPPGTSESVVRSFTKCVVSALSYVHSRGITHCDVKGRNILLGSSPGSAKLADFGSAISESDTITTTVAPRGSPLWMAPEVVRREHQGPESDVWSLGCTVIEMVTGKPAWEDKGLETLNRIGYSWELPRLPTGLSESGLDFLDKCLKREPSLRWTCDQLLLHPFLSSVWPTTITVDEPSPRCVLDWFDSVSDSDPDEGVVEAAIQRIGKLFDEAGEKWESEDGWEWVRGSPDLEPEQFPNDDVEGKTEARLGSSWISRRAVSEEGSNSRGSGGPRDELLGGPLYLYGPLKEAVEMIGRVGLVGLGLVGFGPFCNLWPVFFCIERCSSYLLPIKVVMMILRRCRIFHLLLTHFVFEFHRMVLSIVFFTLLKVNTFYIRKFELKNKSKLLTTWILVYFVHSLLFSLLSSYLVARVSYM